MVVKTVKEGFMKPQEVLEYSLKKPGAYLDYPFGDIPVCIKAGGKLFVQLYPVPDDYKITLKCESITGDFYKQLYPGRVVRGYHCPPVQQPYFITVHMDGSVPDADIRAMIDHSYVAAIARLSKKVREQLAEASDGEREAKA